MSKKTKRWLVVGACLVLAGGLLFAGVLALGKGNLKTLFAPQYETNTYYIEEDFQNISITSSSSNIEFVTADDGVIKVVCQDLKKVKHTAAVEDNTLVIRTEDQRAWYDYVGIFNGAAKITIYLPKATHYGQLTIDSDTSKVTISALLSFEGADISLSTGDVYSNAISMGNLNVAATTGKVTLDHVVTEAVNIAVTTGNVTLKGVECGGDISIAVSTGDVALTNVTCKNLTTEGDTGDLIMENVVVTELLTFRRSTGDTVLAGCDAGEIDGQTDTGDVSGNLLSSHIYIVDTDTGKVIVPESTEGGKCKITTDTGSVIITEE